MKAIKANWQTFADAKPKPGQRIVVEVTRDSVRLAADQRGTGRLVYDRELQKEYRTPPRFERCEHTSECRRVTYRASRRGIGDCILPNQRKLITISSDRWYAA